MSDDAEGRLQLAEDAFGLLFEHSPLVSVLYRPVREEGRIEDWTIVGANSAALGRLGLPADRVIGHALSELFPPGEFERLIAVTREIERTGEPRTFEQYSESTGRTYLSSNFLVGRDVYASVSLDVTDARRSREIYARSERMEALTALAAGVGHDFKNILWGIQLYATGLAAAHPAPDPAGEDARQIGEAAEHGMALAGQLLDFARRGKQKVELLDVVEVVSGIEPTLSRLVGDGVALRVQGTSGRDRVLADRSKIEQVVLNLVVNARDAMPDGGRLTLAIEALHLDEGSAKELGLATGRFVCIACADTGIGMTPEVLDRVFEPYFTTKGSGRGMGLGLAIAFGVVREVGGAITAESTPGEGSTFRVYLPSTRERKSPG